ncbi:MAG: FecR family protein [Candidatus Pedobacter colombiensis]|uniref:FecR family protein n=1 Tax=Candidatus Pedobacter colombiensis TaxID=3121371 RepID=A0AAJ5WAV4_9SPHI|nr:FecR family protein [Pedobacter sp.]WEK20215.1 MAG: FecR family protein [Pedobacter sp.]
MKDSKHTKALYQRYLDNDYTAEELKELLEYFYNSANENELSSMIQDELESEENGYESHAAVQSLLHRLDQELLAAVKERNKPVKTIRIWYRTVGAAAILIVLGIGMFFYSYKKQVSEDEKLIAGKSIAPGKNTAKLTLSDGKTISLSDAKMGIVIEASKLTYNDGSAVSESKMPTKNLTVNTPRGGQYRIVLPDGTQVWLNAASVLKFPSSFALLKERKVELIGEAYFEVTKDKNKPFIVKSKGQEVQVLGTHFNINCYTDEASIKTTLIEGSVMVSGKQEHVVLKPNQQAVLNNEIEVKNVDVENEIAWKNGDFIFDSDELESIMRKISRWYDVEVFYTEKPSKKMHFGGIVSRTKDISAVLKIMQSTGQVSFKVEGHKITVTQN